MRRVFGQSCIVLAMVHTGVGYPQKSAVGMTRSNDCQGSCGFARWRTEGFLCPTEVELHEFCASVDCGGRRLGGL